MSFEDSTKTQTVIVPEQSNRHRLDDLARADRPDHLEAFAGYASAEAFDHIVSGSDEALTLELADFSGHLEGSVEQDEHTGERVAHLDYIHADGEGSGRGTYLTAAFVREGLHRGATQFQAFAIHPGMLAIAGKLFGEANLHFYQIGDEAVPTLSDITYETAMAQLLDNMNAAQQGMPSPEHAGVGIIADLANAPSLVRGHL